MIAKVIMWVANSECRIGDFTAYGCTEYEARETLRKCFIEYGKKWKKSEYWWRGLPVACYEVSAGDALCDGELLLGK